jgi:flagellar biosynthesis/type III secretory pathway protein FliH
VAQPQVYFGVGLDGRPQIGVRDPELDQIVRRERWRQRRAEERAQAYGDELREARYERRERWRQRREDERAQAYQDGRRSGLREGRPWR